MDNYTYQNTLVSKKQLRELLSWSFTKYGSVKSCFLADELKYLGFRYATNAGISISIEDLRVPSIKAFMLSKANKAILNDEKIFLKGKITNVERFQKIIDTWNVTSELLKTEIVSYFKKYDPLNSVYMMAFSGARGNLSQVRQLVGMRGLMSDPSGEIMNLPIKKNFREGLTITDYLMSGYGARKGIVDTALKTANSGYLTRRLIDVAQDIIIREKDCLTNYSFLVNNFPNNSQIYNQALGYLLNRPIYDLKTDDLIAEINTQLTPNVIRLLKQKNIIQMYIRSPLTCRLYRSICQKCYGWNLARENLVDIGDAVGIIAGQSIGEPGTQLTMRTFHTGGIFTAATSQQLIGPIDGYVKFSQFLRTSTIRTNRGENVLLTENSGYLTIITDKNNDNNLQLELPRNTILFSKNNQYIKKGIIIGQLPGTIKQIRTEIKPILTNYSGEIFMPACPKKLSFRTINKLLWILAGQVFQIPFNSFLNFYFDYKINKNSYIFRSKIINKISGFLKLPSSNQNSAQPNFEILHNCNVIINSNIYKLSFPLCNKKYLFLINKFKYFINLEFQNSIIPISNHDFGSLITNSFASSTGGIPYYTKEIAGQKKIFSLSKIHFYESLNRLDYRTIIWSLEESCPMSCDSNLLLVENNQFVNENFKLLAEYSSSTSGIVNITDKQNIIKEISIKSGLIYEIDNIDTIQKLDHRIFYPGEVILENIKVTQLCLTEIIYSDSYSLLIRPIEIYEIPLPKFRGKFFEKNFNYPSSINFNLISIVGCNYSSKQKVRENKDLELIISSLRLRTISTKSINKKQITSKLVAIPTKTCLEFYFSFTKLYLSNYIPTYLNYRNVYICVTIENLQFVNAYTTLGYLETISTKSLELVKIKSKIQRTKEILLISNDDCLLLSKSKIKNKTINNFVLNSTDVRETGKIIIDNGDIITIQKGNPYFFPNCKNKEFIDKTYFEYKISADNTLPVITNNYLSHYKSINIHCYDIRKMSTILQTMKNKNIQYMFSQMIIRKRGNMYISGIPIFLRDMLVRRKKINQTLLSNLNLTFGKRRVGIIFVQNSTLFSNKTKLTSNSKTQFASLIIKPYPFPKITLHSVTEDYLEQDLNSVYVKNGEFVENDQTIGLLYLEKEITGDIVQGLPRVEELLEARKKKRLSKRIPKNQKRGLLIRKTSLDHSFEFRKLATTIKDNEKINPHNLLKVYFNYYAKTKTLLVKNQISQLFNLTTLYDASYRSFKKVQSLILNSVQSVYKSQGVSIADKHLEIIIKQMASKVQITRAGDTPLLPHEIIDLYHIQYVNEVIENKKKQPAYYIPILLGITKASLNNPSFISAASFQETTRVLTKAAIEGKHDWLRGLKENIVIGQLIPVGTGLRTYYNFFTKIPYSQQTNAKIRNVKYQNVRINNLTK